jgi:hypothetical protein
MCKNSYLRPATVAAYEDDDMCKNAYLRPTTVAAYEDDDMCIIDVFYAIVLVGKSWSPCYLLVATGRVTDNHSPTRQMRVELRMASKNTNPLASLASIYLPLTDNVYILSQLFSDLASKNF